MEHWHSTHKHRLAIAGLTTALLLASGSVLAEKVYRWVDEDGNVHYTATLPPNHKDAGHDVLNERGIVLDEDLRLTPEQKTEEEKLAQKAAEEGADELPRDSSGLPRPKPLYSEAEKQQRMDNFLMLRYESEQEITDAMNVEIKQLNYDRRLIEGSQTSLNEAWRGHIRIAANRQRSGQKVDANVETQIDDLRSQMAQNARELNALKQREENIKTDFQKQLDRYRYLVEKYAQEEQG